MTRHLAPAAVLRAAAWPLETLDVFGAEELRAAARDGRFASAYDAALLREREALWERTAGDPTFMKALLFASPALCAGVQAGNGPSAPRTKRVRHLETSLYRYLVRAATRTTPNGLWAGVTSAGFAGARNEVRYRARQLEFSPDLRPFARAFALLSTRAAYRETALFRLNPTLRPEPSGDFRFLARDATGAVEARALGADVALARCLERLLREPAAPLAELARAAGAPRSTLLQLVEGGVLVGGLAFPGRFSSAWEALGKAEELLLGTERAALRNAVAALSEICGELTTHFEDASWVGLHTRLARASQVVLDCLTELAVPAEAPEKPLHLDLGLPCQVTLCKATERVLLEVLASYEREWLDGESPLSAARRARRRSLLATLDREPRALGDALPEFGSLAVASAEFERWRSTFDSPSEAIRLAPAAERAESKLACPWGCLLVRLGGEEPAGVLGVDDSPTRPIARHAQRLEHAPELTDWLSALMLTLSAKHGVAPGELLVPFDQNPNVQARPNIGTLPIDPWGASGPVLAGATLRNTGGAIVLDLPGHGHTIVLSLSMARTLGEDPLAERLVLSGFDENVLPGFRASNLFSPDEFERPRFAPRLCLSSGTVLRARRTCLQGEVLARLTAARRVEAYPTWQAFAREMGWPSRVAVSVDGGTPLWLDLSSPLALEAALEGVGKARRMVIEEASPAGFLKLADGTHLTDLLIPFSRSEHAFSALSSSGSRCSESE